MINIEIDKSELAKTFDALDKMASQAIVEKDRLPEEQSIDLRDFIKDDAITGQEFSGQWAPYSKEYEDWKFNEVGHLRFWELSGALAAAIRNRQVAKGLWTVEIIPGAVNKDGDGIEEYAAKNEARRPLFSTCREWYVREGEFKKMAEKSMKRIADKWGR